MSSIDVSFISLTKVLLPVRNLLTEDGQIVCLIKPQFEAGREKVGKKGVVQRSSCSPGSDRNGNRLCKKHWLSSQ